MPQGESDALYHITNLREQIIGVAISLREHVDKVDDQTCKTLFHTSYEVLFALASAFETYALQKA